MKRIAAPKNHEHKRFYLRHAVPVTVWLVAVASVVWLFQERASRFEVVGIARGEVREVAATSTGRIKDITVTLYQPVMAGQTLAVVDTILDNEQTLEAELRAELAEAVAEIEHLAAQLIPTEDAMQTEAQNLEISRTGDLNRLAIDVDNYRVRVMQLQATILADEMTLDDLDAQQKTLEKLVAEGAIALQELDTVKGQRASLARKIKGDSALLDQAKVGVVKAEERLGQFSRREVARPSVNQALEVIHKEIRVQEELMQGLLGRLKALKSRETVELKSPIEGRIIPIPVQENDALNQRPGERVMRRIGEVVRAGDPIVAVALEEPTEVVAYVNEQQLSALKKDMAVELVKIRTPAQIAESRIAEISPTMELMPQRLWRSPNSPQWGRPVLISIPPGLSLVPGEVVGIRGL